MWHQPTINPYSSSIAMFKCLFCGLDNPSEKARFCNECGPDNPAKSWTSEEIDQPAKVAQYITSLSEIYFDTKNNSMVEKFSLRWRERLQISFDTHSSVITKLETQKKAITHLANFRFEFNENVIDAYAGHDTFLNFRYTNLSEDDLFKVGLFWDDSDTLDRIDIKAETKSFVKPMTSVTIGASAIFDRIGMKELSDLQITITDQFGESANFRVEPFVFKVGNHDQKITQNISTHNQISIEGRGVVDASGMGTDKAASDLRANTNPQWKELSFVYVPADTTTQEEKSLSVTKASTLQSVQQKVDKVDSAQANVTHFNKDDLLSVLKSAEEGNADAQFILGKMYMNGKGVAQDHEKAIHWYRLAAEQGNADSQNNLGLMYDNGWGVAQDDEKAVHWYRLAAEHGSSIGQFNLGSNYLFGSGVAQDYEKAVHWYRLAAEQSNAKGQFGLGNMYQNGMGVVQDNEKAVHWYRLAAEQGDAPAQSRLGGCYWEGLGVPQDHEKAANWYRLAAEQADAVAQNMLGYMYQCGEGVAQDNDKAVHWYRLAAEQGNAVAQNNLGLMYDNGLGVAQDNDKAVHWYRLAAEQGNADAQNMLGYMYQCGERVAQDHEMALYWFRLAGEQGVAQAQKWLGYNYLNGLGVVQDHEKSVHWYRLAAEQGDAQAQSWLGDCYHKGLGVAQDHKKAAHWYRLAAEQADAVAQNMLGYMYQCGEGVAQDNDKAVHWYRLAAEQGNADAQNNLGLMYDNGLGVAQNHEKAVHWYRLAAEQGHADSIESLKLEPHLSTTQPPSDGYGSWDYGNYTYTGMFENGQWNGLGELIWSGDNIGHRYVGNFVNGLRHGQGTYTFPNGVTQVGIFENNVYQESKTEIKNVNGSSNLFWNDGTTYTGQAVDGIPNGHGCMTYGGDLVGHIYVGFFVNGSRHGKGRYRFPNGTVQVGQFENNEFIAGRTETDL